MVALSGSRHQFGVFRRGLISAFMVVIDDPCLGLGEDVSLQ